MLATKERPTTKSADGEADVDLFRALRGASPYEMQRIYALLVARHRGLVGWLASRYAGRGVEIDELRQIGYLGLVSAIRRYDPDRGVEFAAFARPTVQGEIQRYFRDRRRWIRLPRRLQETKAALCGARDELVHTLGRWPTVPELAAFLNVGEAEVREALATDDTYELRSLDEPVSGEGNLMLAEVLGGPDPRIDLVVDRHVLRGLMTALPERDLQIVLMRFFGGQTQSEIGDQLGISQTHVSRLLSNTLVRLRAEMEEVD